MEALALHIETLLSWEGSTLMNTQCLSVLLKLETEKSKSLGKMYFENFHLWAVCGHIHFKSHK